MEGFLTKRGHFIHNWKVRYFVLNDYELYYYKDQEKQNQKGKCVLTSKSKISFNPDDGIRRNIIIIDTMGNNSDKDFLFLSADSEGAKQRWFHHIKLAIAKLSGSKDDEAMCMKFLASTDRRDSVDEIAAPTQRKSGFKSVNALEDSDDEFDGELIVDNLDNDSDDEDVEEEEDGASNDIDPSENGVRKGKGNGSAKTEVEIDPSHVTVDERGIKFSTNVAYADETVEVLKKQLMLEGKRPMEYIPLPDLRAELATIFDKANSGQPYDEGRLDYLLMCMEFNPEYAREKEAENQKWRDEIDRFAKESLETMKGFVPPYIFHASTQSLVEEDGMCTALAKRLMTKKCLWLVRITASDIERVHIAELRGRFNPEAQGLDLVETAAIYAAIPAKFNNDPDGKKERWRASIEQSLKTLWTDKQKGKLTKAKERNAAYIKQESLFTHRETMHDMSITSGDAFKPRDSFRNLKFSAKDLEGIQEEGGGDEDGDDEVAAPERNNSKVRSVAERSKSLSASRPPEDTSKSARPPSQKLSSQFAGISAALNRRFSTAPNPK